MYNLDQKEGDLLKPNYFDRYPASIAWLFLTNYLPKGKFENLGLRYVPVRDPAYYYTISVSVRPRKITHLENGGSQENAY